EIAGIAHARSGVETVITRHARARRWRVTPVVMHGVTHTMKEEKIGALRGAFARLRMYSEIARSLLEKPQEEVAAADLAPGVEVRMANDELEGGSVRG